MCANSCPVDASSAGSRMYSLLILCLLATARAQDCKVGGQRCADHEQCCGGCCSGGYCVDTYRSCLVALDVCREHACRGEENCVPYQPPGCARCEPLPLCRAPADQL